VLLPQKCFDTLADNNSHFLHSVSRIYYFLIIYQNTPVNFRWISGRLVIYLYITVYTIMIIVHCLCTATFSMTMTI
jgi:hypothetical protein